MNSILITTCLVKYVGVRAQGETTNSITVNSGTSVPIEAYAIDTLGYTLTKVPLVWATNNLRGGFLATAGNSTGSNSATARNNSCGADVTASCTPPTCNIGVYPGLPVYASDGLLPNQLQAYAAISVDVTGGANPASYLGWTATNQCADVSGCSSVLFQITPGTTTNPITASVTALRTPNLHPVQLSGVLAPLHRQ